MSSDSGDDISVASGGGSDFSAECIDEYSVDSDGNIKPGQDIKQLPKSIGLKGNKQGEQGEEQ